MLPSLIGVIASSGGAAGSATSYESIATVTVGSGGTSSVSFTSIPSTYQHLQVRAFGRMTDAGTSANTFLTRYNNDTTAANYRSHRLLGENTTVYAQDSSGQQGVSFDAQWPRNSSGANCFGAMVLDILDYANTSKYKTTRSLNGSDDNSTSVTDIALSSGLWMSTSAINRIDFVPTTGFAQYSSFALYGIKG